MNPVLVKRSPSHLSSNHLSHQEGWDGALQQRHVTYGAWNRYYLTTDSKVEACCGQYASRIHSWCVALPVGSELASQVSLPEPLGRPLPSSYGPLTDLLGMGLVCVTDFSLSHVLDSLNVHHLLIDRPDIY